MSDLSLPLTGSCQCGQVQYRTSEEPLTLYCCHCTECQRQSASAFGMSLRLPAGAVQIEGEVATFVRGPGTKAAVECVFCPACGTRLLHRGRGGSGESLKAGTLDQKQWLEPVGHIWMRSAQGWFGTKGLRYEEQPDDDYAALIDAFRQRFLGKSSGPHWSESQSSGGQSSRGRSSEEQVPS